MIVYGQNPTELKKEKHTTINSRQCKVNSQINQLYVYRLATRKCTKEPLDESERGE